MYNMVLTPPFILREPSNPILGTASLFFVLAIQGLNAVITLIFSFIAIFSLAIERTLYPS